VTRNSYAFLGPRGTFAEAAWRVLDLPDAQAQPAASVTTALDLVRSGEVRGALVPIENSVEGSVSTTLDELATGSELVITAEVSIPVQFALLARPGTSLSDVQAVATHPHAQAQCRGWLAQHLPGAVVIPAMSTAGAAAALTEGATYDAAIAQRIAAEHYGLQILADDIADNDDATTRFIVVEKPGELPSRTGADKTTLVLFMHADHPGALLEILTELSVRGINMTRIESRPTRRAMGDYFFSIDCEGHVADERVGEALKGLHRICSRVRFLGSYPRHDGRQALLRNGVEDADFTQADEWLRRVRAGETG
jgi:prephenate dehydratase